MLKKYLENQVEEKRSQIETLEKAIIERESKEERAKIGETLTKVRRELEEAEKALGEAEDQEKEEEEKEHEEAGQRARNILGTYGMRAGSPEGKETREKDMDKVLEQRGADLKAKRAITVESSDLVLPKHTGTVLNDTFTPVSTLVDRVGTENLPGGESYEEAYVKSYGTGGITGEGDDYTDTEPEFGYAPINKIKVTAYAEISEEVKKLPNIDYARKVQEACRIALKKKLSQQIIAGTGTKEMVGITASPVAVDSAKDVEITEIGLDTLNEAVFGYGGDEDVETQAVVILNKKTLKALSEVRKANGDPAYAIDVEKKTINTIHKASDAQKIFIIADNPQDVLKLVEGGVPIKRLNVGNMHMSDGKRQVATSVAVDDADIEAFTKLRDLGVEIFIQRVPDIAKEDASVLFKK